MNFPIGLVAFKDSATMLLSLLKNRDIKLWTPSSLSSSPAVIPENTTNIVEHSPLEELSETPVILVTLPALHVRNALRELGDVITGRHMIVHTARNIEPATHKTVTTMIDEETPVRRVGFFTGPLSVDDLCDGRVSAACCATQFPEVADALEELLGSRLARLQRTDDIEGAEAAARYTRVIAFAYAMISQLDPGRSAQAMLTCRGMQETAQYVTYSGGYEKTAYSLAGLGNFHLDVIGQGSRDAEIGRAIAKKVNSSKEIRSYIESTFHEKGRDLISLIEALYSETQHSKLPLSLLSSCYQIITGGCSVRGGVKKYIS